ncbi:MAG: elongation factor G, partial [Desulfuromonadales bacterium]|nr:elongation factor G [Desulfuromonadales bacterium]
ARPPDRQEETLLLSCDPQAPLCALAFKVVADEGRKLTYLRLYAGCLQAGDTVWNSRLGAPEKLARLFRMHAHKRERIETARAGDIVAAAGLRDVLTGDTLCSGEQPLLLRGLTIPEPVVSLAVEARTVDDREKLPAALDKLQWEDPTFRVHEDSETGQTLLTGMGELHLEILITRLEREFGVRVQTGRPQVVYRETLRKMIEHRELFHREAAGRMHKGEVLLRLSPLPRGSGLRLVFPAAETSPLPLELRSALEAALTQGCAAGARTGYPLIDLQIEVVEAPFEPGATTELGLRAAAQRGVALAAQEAKPTVLEPIMRLELTTPAEHAGKVLGSLQQKRGRIEGMLSRPDTEVIRAFVPLAEMFGYMTELRSATRGRGAFTMEFSHYDLAPAEIQKRFGLT